MTTRTNSAARAKVEVEPLLSLVGGNLPDGTRIEVGDELPNDPKLHGTLVANGFLPSSHRNPKAGS